MIRSAWEPVAIGAGISALLVLASIAFAPRPDLHAAQRDAWTAGFVAARETIRQEHDNAAVGCRGAACTDRGAPHCRASVERHALFGRRMEPCTWESVHAVVPEPPAQYGGL